MNVEVWPKPFYVNNVETYANICLILGKGAEWFASLGSKSAPGTKIFALTGKTNHPCLVEAPVGATLADLIKMADGDGRSLEGELKAFQMGGPSGGIFPERFKTMPMDFDSLPHIGWKVGSGYVVLMDEKICTVEMVRYSMSQLINDACDRCQPCSKALKHLQSILNRLSRGLGEMGDLETLESFAHRLQSQARCEFGRAAATPVLTSLRYFRNEYESHLQHHCPANFCKDLSQDRTLKLAA